MIEHALSRIGGVGLYGVISICLFFAVFVGVLLWTLGLTKPYLKAMRELPLEGEAAPDSEFESPSNLEHNDERV